MNKQEALERLDALEVDESKWIGRWVFFSRNDKSCKDNGLLQKLIEIKQEPCIYVSSIGSEYEYFRPATLKELGVMEFFKELPKNAEYIVIAKDGGTFCATAIIMHGALRIEQS